MQAHELLKNLDGQVKPLATSAQLTLGEAKKLFKNAAKLAAQPGLAYSTAYSRPGRHFQISRRNHEEGQTRLLTGSQEKTPLRLELIKTLNEFASAARSFRVLAEYLENHPEALIRGKGK